MPYNGRGTTERRMVMSVRTGKEYIDGLKARSPEVWIGGERVADVTNHPALRPSMEQIAHLFDMQHDPAYADVPDLYVPHVRRSRWRHRSCRPSTVPGLKSGHACYRVWAEATLGLMGRSPDFMNVVLLSFAEEPRRLCPRRRTLRREHGAVLRIRPRK